MSNAERRSIWKSDLGFHTKPIIETVQFSWTLENVWNLGIPIGERLVSNHFHSKDNKWSLHLYPNGNWGDEDVDDDDAEGEFGHVIGLFLSLEEPPPGTNVNIKYKFYILNAQDEIEHTKTDLRVFKNSINPVDANSTGDHWGFPRFIAIAKLRDEPNRYLVNGDTLKIGVEMNIIKSLETVPTAIEPKHLKHIMKYSPKDSIYTDYSEFYNNEKFSDVKIVDANGEIIPAHKVFLAKQSEQLESMFEKQQNLVTLPISHPNPSVLRQVLKFMYSGRLETQGIHNTEVIRELFLAAFYLGVYPLLGICEQLLIEKLTKENCINLLEFSVAQHRALLKECAIICIVTNKDFVLQSSEWKEFLKKQPDLVNDIILKLTKVNLKRKANEVGVD